MTESQMEVSEQEASATAQGRATPPTHSFHALTMNTFGVPTRHTSARMRTLARHLNDSHLDAVCLQEVQLTYYNRLLRREFHAFPHAAYEPHVYAPKGGLLTLSRHTLDHFDFRPFTTRRLPLGPALADWALYKGALVAEVAAQATPVIIVNTHLNANYDGNWSHGNRYAEIEHRQAQQLAEVVQSLDPQALVLVVGDFNFPRGCWVYDDFVQTAGVVDPQAAHLEPTFRPHSLVPSHFALPIDFTFVRAPHQTAIQARAEILFDDRVELVNGKTRHLSDHRAIRVDVSW